MKMKLLDYTLICILTGVVRVAGAQTPPPTAPTSPPSKTAESAPGDGGNTVNCDDGGCASDQGVLFELRTRGERKPLTHGTSEKSSSEVLQPDRRVTVEAEDVNSAWQNKPLPGKAVVVGKWSLQLPGGGAIWATEDPNLGRPQMTVSAPTLVAFDGTKISKPVRFYAYNNYAAFIKRAEVLIYRATDADLVEPIARIDLPLAGVSDVQWDGAMSGDRNLRAGDELIYIVRAYGEGDSFDETFPSRLQLVRPEEAERGAQVLRDATQKQLGASLSVEEAEQNNQIDSIFGRDNLRQQNIPIYGSRIRIQGRNIADRASIKINGRPHPVDIERKLVAEYLVPVGQHRFDIEIGGAQGSPPLHRSLDVDVTGRYMFAVALADVTASKTHATGSIEPVSDNERFDDGFLIDGRLAFYLKGKVRGKYLITAQADTQEREVGQLFNGFWKADPQDVFRRLDPDLYYPVYGDDSTTYRDVDTMGRLYLRMDWDKNQALWGNFNTGFTGTEYAQYNRSLYGGALDWRSRRTTALGDAGTQLRLFGSQAQTAPGHTELIGTGGRLYYLKHGDILPGSEKLTVEVRDPTTGRVQNRVDLMRGADYEIDELQGRILLDKPLSQVSREGLRTLTHDTPLDGYLQVLLVDYEYVPDGLDVDNVSAGFRGKHWFGDHLAVGGTYVDENRDGEDYTLKGADLTLQAGRGTYLKLEGSRSQATSAPIFFSDNGGLSFRELNSGLLAREGEARSAEARANFKELGWTQNEWTVAVWRRHVGAGYSISRYDTDQAVEERGFEFFGELTPAVRLFGRHSVAERGKESFTQSQLTGEWRLNDDITLSGEVRTVQENRLSGDATGTLAALEYRQRVGSQLELFGTAQVTVDDDHGKYADNDAFSLGAKYLFGDRSSVGAEVTSGDRGDAAKVDAEYRLAPDHTLYGSYTYSANTSEQDPLFNDRLNSGWTLGQRWRLSNQVSLFNESQFLKAPNESGLAHTYGMDFYPSEGWSLGFTLQEATLDRAAELGQVNRRAVSVSGGRNSVDTQWSSKLEWRRDSGAERREQWTSSNRFLHKLNDSFRIAGRLNYSQTRDLIDAQAGAKFVEGNVGFSWRPYNDTRWALLGKYTFLYDVSALEQVGPNIASYDQRTQVLSFEGIYHPNHHWEFAGKLARREGEVRYGRLQGQWADSATTFGAAQARYEFAQVWHGLAEYRWLGVKKGGDKQGLLLGIDRDIGKNFRVGVGYNFTEFSDDLTDFDYDHRGWFLNMVGSY
ncbi:MULTISPECIES: hypothetical protein [unclassified Lysobacter]|uniref:hypothetical protein n=1 Tax=unclassified Lysobacter TaxID=2635362 RepID=UPI001BEA4B4D|nr:MULTISPECIES: hypothetical protein [unclassified Lysobacter]MBT2748127.1 hypothetical protein [Lysobacter sp. ISL-42]MBT2754167.1 hypothetical protein [Lysobacter sp. ISL-50]MBT2776007.1 hypothetical protein [Lysobacter sp. ISL-54]MBT2784154.1 hypothetical protein [Lysobacter sp. ISL-52]